MNDGGLQVTVQTDLAFRIAARRVIRHEGGYVNDPRDAGGETKYGISKASYPDIDIANLTEDEAIAIYHSDWWVKYRYGEIRHDAIAGKVFDFAVNAGPGDAGLALQRALRAVGISVVEDGIVGSKTLAAVNDIGIDKSLAALAAYRSEMAGHYRLLVALRPALSAFLKGWLARAYD